MQVYTPGYLSLQVMHPSGVERLRERLLRLQRVDILEECGHSCSMERPGQVAKLLLAFREQTAAAENGLAAQL